MATAPRRAFTPRLPRIDFIRASIVFGLVLLVASWVYLGTAGGPRGAPLFSDEMFSRAARFMRDLAGVGRTSTPAFAQGSEWWNAARLAYDTLAMSVLAILIAGAGALATFMLGARNVMTGELAPNAGVGSHVVFWIMRIHWAITRAVPELVWALLIVFVLSPGILPGAVALGIHNLGVLARLASEVVEGMDTRPVRALQAAGAGRTKALLYGVLPTVLPRFMTYLLYRWEVIIRTTIVVGFVSAGGLGMEFRLAMSNFHYTTVTLILMTYLVLVFAVDIASSQLRRLAR